MFNLKSLKSRMIICFGLMIWLTCTILGVLSSSAAKSAVRNSERIRLESLADKQCEIVKARLDRQKSTMITIARSRQFTSPDTGIEEKLEYASQEIEDTGMSGVTYVDLNGNIIFGDLNLELPSDFVDEMLKKENRFAGPFASGEEYYLAVSTLVKDREGNATGILIGTETLKEFTALMTTNEGESFFILNAQGDTMANVDEATLMRQENLVKDKEKFAEDYGDMVKIHEAMTAGETGFTGYYDSVSKSVFFIAYAPVGTWSVAFMEKEDAVNSRINQIVVSTVITVLIMMIVAIAVTYLIANEIAKNVQIISRQLEVYATGDFTEDVPESLLSKKSEVGVAGRSMQLLKESMVQMIGKVKKSTEEIKEENNKLLSIAGGVLENAQGISEATNQVAEGVSSQSADLVGTSQFVEGFGKKLDHVVDAVGEVHTRAASVSELVTDGNKNTELLISSVENIRGTFKAFIDKMSGLNHNITQITDITTVINGIAEQTNLLALNASIEAARAGEAGKGFAVVAEEIRKLAEQSKGSAAHIAQLIQGVTNESEEIIFSTGSLNNELSQQAVAIEKAMNDYKMILVQMNEVIGHVSEVDEAASEIISDKNAIIEKIESATAVAQEVAASAEEIAASAESTREAANHADSSVNELYGLTDQMLEEVNQFKL